jgi:hypothetical protein
MVTKNEYFTYVPGARMLKGSTSMSSEEQQIQDFVHAMQQDPAFRERLLADPDAELAQLGYSKRVVRILKEQLPVIAEVAPLPPPFQHFK